MSDSPFPRSLWPRALAFALIACSTFAPPTNVLVTRTPPGDKAVQEEGTSLHLGRWDIGLAREGLKRGFFVVKSDLEWRALWPSTSPDRVPLLPFDIDFGKEMLLVSSPGDPAATASEVRSVILTDRAVHVYVTQTVLGTDCPETQDSAAKNYALVRTPRIDDKDVSYHVDTTFGDACGKPPEATITCKLDGSSDAPVGNLKAEPGRKVVCGAADLRSARPIFDLTWVWDGLPIGSAAKINVARGARSVSFVPDVIGTYRLALEVSDDLARKGKVTGEVAVPPPAGPLALQFLWTNVDARDDPDTFPRMELRVFGMTAEMVAGAKARAAAMSGPGQRSSLSFASDGGTSTALVELPSVAWTMVKACTVTIPLSWCTAKLAGPTTVVTLDPAWAPQFAVAVHFVDERVPGQPVPCLRSFRDGKLAAERCDPGKRNADSFWEVGVIDALTGKTPEMLAQEQKAAAARAAAAADAGAVREAGRVDGVAPDAPHEASAPKG